jgi:hypothetical protein
MIIPKVIPLLLVLCEWKRVSGNDFVDIIRAEIEIFDSHNSVYAKMNFMGQSNF